MTVDRTKKLLLIGGDILIIPLSYAATFFVRFGTLDLFLESFPPLLLAVMILVYVSTYYVCNVFTVENGNVPAGSMFPLALAVVLAALFLTIVNYTLFLFPIGRGILLMANGLIFALGTGWRWIFRRLYPYVAGPRKTVLIGTGEDMDDLIRVLESRSASYELLSFPDGPGVAGSRVKDTVSRVTGAVPENGKALIVLAQSARKARPALEDLIAVRMRGITVVDALEMIQAVSGRIPVRCIEDDRWFFEMRGLPRGVEEVHERGKRIVDIALASLILLAGLPLWPVIALLIKATSRGPVFYAQNRVGKNEEIFRLHKFRSMIPGAEKKKPVWAGENDERITRAGRILRRLHLDELPQLWDVLRGKMSLVGPRPERPEFVAALKAEIPAYSLRHLVKPGLTGWAQVNYPYAASIESSREKLEYDLYYVVHKSLRLDLVILARTARKVFSLAPEPTGTQE